MDDLDKAQSDVHTMDVYMKRAVVAMNNMVEAKILQAYTYTPPADQLAGPSGEALALTSDTDPTTGIYQLFCKARSIQSKNNVPSIPGSRWAVIDPDTTTLLLQDTEHFIRAGELGDKVVQYGNSAARKSPVPP